MRGESGTIFRIQGSDNTAQQDQSFDNYQPNPAILQKIRQIDLIAVVGPSGVGKTTLINAAVTAGKGLQPVVSFTSRQPRPNEKEGIDFYFRSKEEMSRRCQQGEFVQVAPNVTGDIYASAPESYTGSGVAVMPVWADAIPLFRTLPFRTLRVVFIVPPSFEVWQARLRARKVAPAQLPQRLAEARRSFAFALSDNYVICLINDDLVAATKALGRLAKGKLPVAAEQQRARDIIAAILTSQLQTGNHKKIQHLNL